MDQPHSGPVVVVVVETVVGNPEVPVETVVAAQDQLRELELPELQIQVAVAAQAKTQQTAQTVVLES
jgi:hypothetical protein